jgi:LmbE family N-acetylglucosaminyl deacetylase
MLREITFLSPHRDDAVFSAFLCLSRWSRIDIQLRVINFFTISSYAPQIFSVDTNAVSFIRAREDRKALLRAGGCIHIIDCDLLDAPIRLKIGAQAISKPETHSLLTDDQIEIVARRIRPFARDSLFLAPLTLGDHVDHIAVRAAAVRCIAPHRIACCEDLPYATWTPKDALEAHVADVECATGTRLKPIVVRSQHALWRKRRAAALYKSQATREDATAIARWTAEYGGGERIWAPAHSRAWRAVLETSNAAVFE